MAFYTGERYPIEVNQPEYSIDSLKSIVQKYIQEKAYEPKTSYLAATAPPILGGAALGKIVSKLTKSYPKVLPIAAGFAGLGLGLKLKSDDDKLIDDAKAIMKQPYQDFAMTRFINTQRKSNV